MEEFIMIVGTRGSKLAIAQTNSICEAITKITGEDVDRNIIKTKDK